MTAVRLSQALVFACLGVGVVGLAAWRFAATSWATWLWRALGSAVAGLALAAWGVRWAEAQHLPLFGTYEGALSLVVAVTALGAWAEWRKGWGQGVSPALALVSAALLAHGLRYDTTPWALTISERSLVVDAHAVIAWAAFAVLALNAGLSALTLWAPADRAAAALPVTLEWGFFLHTGMLGSGALYRFLLFGRAWAFDPVETLGFVAWLGWGTLLHLHFFARWRDRRLAAWCLGLFVLVVVSYRGIVYFPSWATYHVFDINLREHLMR